MKNNRKTKQHCCQGMEVITLRKATRKEAVHHQPIKAKKLWHNPPTGKNEEEGKEKLQQPRDSDDCQVTPTEGSKQSAATLQWPQYTMNQPGLESQEPPVEATTQVSQAANMEAQLSGRGREWQKLYILGSSSPAQL